MAGRGITQHGSPCLADFSSDPTEDIRNDAREGERQTSLFPAVGGVTEATVLSLQPCTESQRKLKAQRSQAVINHQSMKPVRITPPV